MTEGYDLEDALNYIDPAGLDYSEWAAVGMALHHEGYPMSVWRDWSRRDARRFVEADFERKWRGFGHESGTPVTGGTIVKLAKDRGWSPERPHRALSWDSPIGGREARRMREAAPAPAAADEPAIVDPSMVGDFDADVRPIYPTGGAAELRDFIDALFEDGETVGYVVDFMEKADDAGHVKLVPGSRGVYTRTAGDIKAALAGGIDSGIGTVHDESGAWMRFNPLDGQGVGNANVTAYRFALLESDDMPVGKFAAIVRQLNLPVAAMVHSGGKSLHAIVRVDAEDAKQYRERVETLYARCEKNGITVDKANKNPSRLCRMPGVTRGGRRQFLASLAQGAADWDEWEEWYAAETDELPDAEPLDIDLEGERPEMAAELIEGVLRVGDKMLLAGPSKAGKSFALMELCAAFAEGEEGPGWFGHKVASAKVLYVNLELTAQSCRARFYDVFKARGTRDTASVVPWNLKGMGRALSRLKPALVRRVRKTGATVIIIDPIYKVMMGDENNARDMSEFTNALDEIIRESGASLIYCHHHSKGYQGEKRSIDRASGSGVFGRDADAIVDMIELDVPDEARNARASVLQCDEVTRTVEAAGMAAAWTALGGKMLNNGDEALRKASELLEQPEFDELAERCRAIWRKRESMTAWRVSYTLREFERIEPTSMWFDWPVHVIDSTLAAAREAGAEQPKASGSGTPRSKKSTAAKKNEAIAEAVQSCAEDCIKPTRANVLERLQANGFKKPSKATFADWTRHKSDTEWCEWKAVEEDGEHVLKRSKGGPVTPGDSEITGPGEI